VFAFKLLEMIKKIKKEDPYVNGERFIENTELIPTPIKKIVLGNNSNNITYFYIAPTSLAHNTDKVFMMDWTREGWVRLPCRFETPRDDALWRLRPVQNGKYFLIDTQKWPDWYLYMKNDDEGRIMSWKHDCSPDEIDDPQSLWMITPTKKNNQYVFMLSTKKWPKHFIYFHDLGFEWIHGKMNPDTTKREEGLFYLRPNMQENAKFKASLLPPFPGGQPFVPETFAESSDLQTTIVSFKI
jgi:hypothetical protein